MKKEIEIETLAEIVAKEEKRLKAPIYWKTRKDFTIREIRYIKRLKVIAFFDEYNTLFYEIDTESMDFKEAKDWFWHLCEKNWMLENIDAIRAIRNILQDVLTIQTQKEKQK